MQFPSPANEDFFFTPRARNSPIKSSMTTLEGFPDKLKIFRIAGSKYWQVRLFNNGKYISRSLKTTDSDEAKEYGKKFYFEQIGNNVVFDSNITESSKLINQDLLYDLIQEVLSIESQKVKRDEIKNSSFIMTKGRLEGLIFDFLKEQQLSLINTDTITEFINYLTSKKLAQQTILGYLAHFKKILKLLFKKEIIQRLPLFPSLKLQIHSRGAFTISEYILILRQSKTLRTVVFDDWGEGKRVWIKGKYHTMPVEMNWLIRFMVYTFLRPGDIRQLKHKHVEIIKGNFNYLRLTLPEIKRHKAPIVSLPSAVGIYERIIFEHKNRGYGNLDDYVFFPEEKNRVLMLNIIGWLLNWILKSLNLKQGPHGTDRSLYSLRHTAITFRLIYGGNIDLLTLARNARTSVEMIEKFYASTLSAEMNISLLHAKRKAVIK